MNHLSIIYISYTISKFICKQFLFHDKINNPRYKAIIFYIKTHEISIFFFFLSISIDFLYTNQNITNIKRTLEIDERTTYVDS